EDTDRARNTAEAARAIYEGLRWLGLDWDEGPEAGGIFGPYFSSEREEIYRSYLERLRAADRVYDDAGSVRFRFAREKVVVDDVIRLFELEKVHRKNAAFDLDKCTWLNGEYLRELSDERFQEMGRQALEKAGIDLAGFSLEYVHAALETCKGKFRIFSELPA